MRATERERERERASESERERMQSISQLESRTVVGSHMECAQVQGLSRPEPSQRNESQTEMPGHNLYIYVYIHITLRD